jgi:hypothetical protein
MSNFYSRSEVKCYLIFFFLSVVIKYLDYTGCRWGAEIFLAAHRTLKRAVLRGMLRRGKVRRRGRSDGG